MSSGQKNTSKLCGELEDLFSNYYYQRQHASDHKIEQLGTEIINNLNFTTIDERKNTIRELKQNYKDFVNSC